MNCTNYFIVIMFMTLGLVIGISTFLIGLRLDDIEFNLRMLQNQITNIKMHQDRIEIINNTIAERVYFAMD